MKRIIPTSTGFVAIDFSGKGWGDVELYDHDGWKVDAYVWGMRGYWDDAADVLGEHSELDEAEITRITAETNAQYEQRGGDEGAREAARPPREARPFVIALAAGVVLAAAALVIGLAFLITWLLL